MSAGQTVGKLLGHLIAVSGVGLALWGCLRFLIWGNAPSFATGTVLWFVYGMGLEAVGRALVWFAGGEGE